MTAHDAPTDWAAQVLAGDQRAAARLMRGLEDGDADAIDALRALYPHTGKAFVVGITGNPGAGKSTVVDELIVRLRARGERVGVVAVDPSSPFSGGAILGDRIRMQRHTLDDGVFIRSLATRGALGGLSGATADVVHVMDALGCSVILIETVGVGQDEVDIVQLADTVVVITVPGLGDDVQALKAGILEIADVLVVNKADREGIERTERDLVAMLGLRGDPREQIEIFRTVATAGTGMDALWDGIDRHRSRQRASGRFQERRKAQAESQVRALVLAGLRRRVESALAGAGGVGSLAEEVAARRTDPYTAAEFLFGQVNS